MAFVVSFVSLSGKVLYIKHTAHFGYFYGYMNLTENKSEAFRFTRRKDAEAKGKTVDTYIYDRKRFPDLRTTAAHTEEI